jgi:hypothetical protein
MLPNQSICINIYIFRDVAFSAGGATCSLFRLYLSECVCFTLVVTEKRNKAEKRVFTVQKKSTRLFTARGVKCGSQGVSRAPLHSCAAMSCSRFAASGRRMQNKVTRRRQSPPPSPPPPFVQRTQPIGSRNGTLSGPPAATFPLATADLSPHR